MARVESRGHRVVRLFQQLGLRLKICGFAGRGREPERCSSQSAISERRRSRSSSGNELSAPSRLRKARSRTERAPTKLRFDS